MTYPVKPNGFFLIIKRFDAALPTLKPGGECQIFDTIHHIRHQTLHAMLNLRTIWYLSSKLLFLQYF